MAERHQPQADQDRQRLVEGEVGLADGEQVELAQGDEREDCQHEEGVGLEKSLAASRRPPA